MKHVTDLIQAYVADDLESDRMAAVEKHLLVCPDCRSEAGRAQEVWDLLGTAGQVPREAPSVWPSVRARTLGRTAEREWFFGTGRLTRASLATAALAAGLVLGILLPVGVDGDAGADSGTEESSWLYESSWLSGSSWLASEGNAGLDDILLGADLLDEGDGS